MQGEDGDVLQNVNTAIAPITFLVTTATAQLPAAHHRKDRIRSQRRRREETEDRYCSQGDRGNLLGLGHSRF